MQGGKYVTENPWSVDHEDGNDNTHAPIGGPDGQVVALVVMDDENRADRWDDTELDANACLIAAAPDLLEALEAMINKATKQNWNDQYPEVLEKAFAAVDKARGA
jgi:phage gp29-like protein